ncbi:hypothetical protein [Ornithinimicrobium avium]|uniref:Uncharacterized protein n=1 Tax=Ornithinimicrobium avium TaxID=2283195 RepID=A0A345NK99_9MICO|nr:hypothetical protein [Ornithinimicrobium avium]AXH95457.1 hypothetical protein DV701_04325 [Ornithinimicrobium avium]
MTGTWHDAAVPVRYRDHQVQLGECSDVVGLEQVVLPGCVAYVDPASPWRPPALVVVDGERAGEVLDELWGPEAVDLVRGRSEGTVDIRDAGPGLQDVASLGTARWVERWQPYPLDPGLLRLDVLVAHARCQELLDPDDEPGGWPAAGELRAAVDHVEAVLAAAADGDAAPRTSVPGWVADLGRPGAVAASVPQTLALAGRSTADWDRVPVRTISRAESAVHWSVEGESDGGMLHVVATAAGDPLPSPAAASWAPPTRDVRLHAQLYVPDWPLPLAVAELKAVREAGAWAGAAGLTADVLARIDRAGPQDVFLDVAVPGLPVPPRTGGAALRARARRWGARCVGGGRMAADAEAGATRARQDVPSEPLRTQVRSAARQAVALWRAAGDDTGAATIQAWTSGEDLGRPAALGLAERYALQDGRSS